MSHATCMQGNRGDPRLLVVKSQIVKLTLGPSFGHNLCLECPNESYEPILNIYVVRTFQWYKEPLNPMGFDPCNWSLKIRESIGTPTPKWAPTLGGWGFIPSHSPTFLKTWNVNPMLPSWPTPLPTFALVVNPRLGLWEKTIPSQLIFDYRPCKLMKKSSHQWNEINKNI
jgi:hypothetical protein